MASEKQMAANGNNAKRSTGPKDTNRTRLNATRHGILSDEVVIRQGDGQEDLPLFDALCQEMLDNLNPVGVIEVHLVEMLIALTWRWRRIYRYEAAAIRLKSDSYTETWEIQQEQLDLLSTLNLGQKNRPPRPERRSLDLDQQRIRARLAEIISEYKPWDSISKAPQECGEVSP